MDEDSVKTIEMWCELKNRMTKGDLEGMDEGFGSIIEYIGKDIKRQRERLGGDWSAAFAIFSRKHR